MTINEVSKKYNITKETLRYYEKIDLLPKITRTKGNIRNYTDEEIKILTFIICMRNAGLSIEAISKYMTLFHKGDKTIKARYELLTGEMKKMEEKEEEIKKAKGILKYKISVYKKALKTGKVEWRKK